MNASNQVSQSYHLRNDQFEDGRLHEDNFFFSTQVKTQPTIYRLKITAHQNHLSQSKQNTR